MCFVAMGYTYAAPLKARTGIDEFEAGMTDGMKDGMKDGIKDGMILNDLEKCKKM